MAVNDVESQLNRLLAANPPEDEVFYFLHLLYPSTIMATLADLCGNAQSKHAAVIIPGKESFVVSHIELEHHIHTCQKQLADLGIHAGAAVSICLPNSLEFIITFLATTWQRGIAAPSNPAYKQGEVEFYVDDLDAAAVMVPRGAHQKESPAVRAARKSKAAVVECYWMGGCMAFDVKEKGKLDSRRAADLTKPHANDVALVLHTSGTTGRPKAVPLTHRNIIVSTGKEFRLVTKRRLSCRVRQHLPSLFPATSRSDDADHASLPRSRPNRIFLINPPRWQRCDNPTSTSTELLDRFRNTQGQLVYSNADDAPDPTFVCTAYASASSTVHPILLLTPIAPGAEDAGGTFRCTRAGSVRHDGGKPPDHIQPTPASVTRSRKRRNTAR